MRRKLVPAIRHLSEQDLKDVPFVVLAIGRGQDLDEEDFQESIYRHLVRESESDDVRKWCRKYLRYQAVDARRDGDFDRLKKRIEALEEELSIAPNRVFYMALPPSAFESTVNGLGEVGLNRSKGWTRIVLEKPFGKNLESARELNQIIHRHFGEKQVYRIDHYLGKETVQNLLVFRFANPIFESSWNRDRVESVQINVAEDLGVGSRAGYYDQSGALRDMIQNHLTQLLCLTAMEVPATFEADFIRDEKVKVLKSVHSIDPEQVVFGQYKKGEIGGDPVPGYRDEDDVDDGSTTETYVSMRLQISNWRWQGVPFFLTTGKRLKERLTQIRVKFRCPPVSLFREFRSCEIHSNELVMTLQPNEGFQLDFEVKSPGQDITVETQRLDFFYAEAFEPLPDAYETLLLDIITGDQTLFVRADEAEASWELYANLLSRDSELHFYPAGSWGPAAGQELVEQS